MTDEDRVLGVRCYHWIPDDGPRNFGDELGPMIIRHLLDAAGVEAGVGGDARLLSVGSVLHFSQPGDTVWGTGVNGKLPYQRIAPPLDVRSVRGPLTRAALLARGVEAPAVFGDPALLMPRVLPIAGAGEGGGGTVVVPNLNDLDDAWPDGVVSPLGDPVEVITAIVRADLVVASSLHALIIADAYGVPSRPVVSGTEHPFKYVDYYAGTGRGSVEFARDVDEAVRMGPVEPADVDLGAIAAAFPVDLWRGERSAPARSTIASLAVAAAAARDALEIAGDGGAQALARLDELRGRFARADDDRMTREEAAAAGLHPTHLARKHPLAAPDLSVVVVARDAEDTLEATVAEVLENARDAEVIVVEAGSTDGTPRVVAQLDGDDDRVRVAWALGTTEGAAIDLGLDLANGRFVVLQPAGEPFAWADATASIAAVVEADAEIAVRDDDEPREASRALIRRRFIESRGLRPAGVDATAADVVRAVVERADRVLRRDRS